MSALRLAFRAVRRQRGSSAVIVLTLAVAIAGATIIYSVADLFWHFLPAQRQERLVFIASTDPRLSESQAGSANGLAWAGVSLPDLADMASRSRTIEQFGGFAFATATLRDDAPAERVEIVRATTSLLPMWGLSPALGRGFRPEEGLPGAAHVALLTNRFWERRFNRSPAVIGRQLLLGGDDYTIVGVLPAAADKGPFVTSDLFVPVPFDPARAPRDERRLFVSALLKPGVSRDTAAADLERIAAQLKTEYPRTNAQTGVVVRPLLDMLGAETRMLMALLLAIAGLLMAIACTNVSNIVLASSASRQREFAVRAALGANVARQVRQVLHESLALSSVACVLGVFLAWLGILAVQRADPTADSFGAINMNLRVVLAAVAVALVAPLGFALLPAFRAARLSIAALTQGGSGAGEQRSTQRLRHTLVAVQMAIAVVLLVPVGAMSQGSWSLFTADKGFDERRLLTFTFELPPARYPDAASVSRFVATLLPRIDGLPGAVSAASITRLPIGDRELTTRIRLEGTSPRPEDQPTVALGRISERYLETMKIPLLQGRDLTRDDVTSRRAVALVSKTAATRYWPSAGPVGRHISLTTGAADREWLEVIGVVGDVRNTNVDFRSQAEIYVPLSHVPEHTLAFVVRTRDDDPTRLATAIRAAVTEVDPEEPAFAMRSMREVVLNDLKGIILLVSVLIAIALASLGLAAAGIYGLTSYSVTRRTREIGVRIALGALPGAVLRLVLAQSTRAALAGAAIGVGAAFAVAPFASAAIEQVNFRDPLVYAGVVLLLIGLTVVASLVPARRATRIEPTTALRGE